MKKLRILEQLDSDIVHSPFFPEEIRDHDGITVKIKKSTDWKEFKLWKYSPFGIEILTKMNEFYGDDVVSIQLKFLEEELTFESVKVSIINNQNGMQLVGFRTFKKEPEIDFDTDRRKSTRWECPQELLPTGSAPNPIRFNDFIIFRIEDISSGGCRLITSMRNRFLFTGQFLECVLSLPLVGNVSATLKIIYIDTLDRDGKPYLVMGAHFIKPDKILLSCLSEYLLHFGQEVSTSTLKKDGFPIQPSALTYDFSYVKTKEEYDQVLDLRKRAYIAANKVDQKTTSFDMADVYDSRSRILITKKNGKVIGSVRVMFHESFNDSELYKDGVKEISGIPFAESVEASRLCVDSNYKGLDIAFNLLSHFSLTAIKANKRYIFGGAHGFLINFYRKSGWKILDTTYNCSSLKDMPHHVVYVDLHEVILGKNISARAWNRLYREMFYYLLERGVIRPTVVDFLRIRFFEFFSF